MLSESVTTTSSTTTIKSGTGTLTVVSGKTLSSSSQLLTLTVDDVDIDGNVETGNAALHLTSWTAAKTVMVGQEIGSNNELQLGDSELGAITSTGMVIRGPVTGTVNVTGVTAANSNSVSKIFTLLVDRDDTRAYFSVAASTFNAISVQADDGVSFSVDLTTDFIDANAAGL